MPVVLKKQIPFTVQIEGQDVRVFIKRMSVEEYAEFASEFLARDKKQTPSESIVRSRAEQTKREVEEALENARWVSEVFEKFITVHSDDLLLENEPITKGAEFVRALADYDGIVSRVLAQIYLVNRLSAAQKKTFSSLFASAIGSTPAPSKAANGPAPETTAANAETKDSVASEPAPEIPSSVSSGETAPSSSASVLSAS